MAKLYFRYGAMNAGKTTALIKVAYNYEEMGMKALVMKPEIDTKGEKYIVSRIGLKRKVDVLLNKSYDLFNKNYVGISCIIVDEAQFLTREQVYDLFKIAVLKDIPVICYGLRTDFNADGFPGSSRLLELAHSIEELKTICSCGKKATMNLRYVNNVPEFFGEQVVIDDDKKIRYESKCPKCYLELKEEYLKKTNGK